ncbi:MAG: LolA family protein [Janthinobacterium lividum]
MHPRRTLTSFSLLMSALLAAPAVYAQAPTPQLAAVLAQMDTASKTFQNATAIFEWDFYEKIVHDTTKQKGSMFLERGKSGTEFGATVYDLSGGPAGNTPSKVISYGAGSLRVYTPAEKQVDAFKAGANQSTEEGYLSIGFGGSGHDLAAAWDIKDGGPEMIAGVKTERLLLVSKDPNVRHNFSQVTLWIDPSRDVSLKQIFDLPGGDQRTTFFSDIRLNGKINKEPFKIPSKGVQVMQH